MRNDPAEYVIHLMRMICFCEVLKFFKTVVTVSDSEVARKKFYWIYSYIIIAIKHFRYNVFKSFLQPTSHPCKLQTAVIKLLWEVEECRRKLSRLRPAQKRDYIPILSLWSLNQEIPKTPHKSEGDDGAIHLLPKYSGNDVPFRFSKSYLEPK